jgi:hypothetical protein
VDTAPLSPPRVRIVQVLVALAWAAWVGAALSPWYTATRVDQDPDTTIGLGIALVPHLLAIAPFVIASSAAVSRLPLPWWTPPAGFVLALPGVAAGLLVPAAIKAGTTDTEVVAGWGVWVLVGAVGLAVAAVAAASRPRPFRTPAEGWTG